MKFKAIVFENGMRKALFNFQMNELRFDENKPLPVYLNFDRSKKLGSVKLTKQDEVVVGDFEIEDNEWCLDQLYPAIGVTVNHDYDSCRVDCVGLSVSPNKDERIPRLPVFAKGGTKSPEV